jgi:hypothetical protein
MSRNPVDLSSIGGDNSPFFTANLNLTNLTHNRVNRYRMNEAYCTDFLKFSFTRNSFSVSYF